MAEQLTLNQLVGSSSLPRLTSIPNAKSPPGFSDRRVIFMSVSVGGGSNEGPNRRPVDADGVAPGSLMSNL
jgi:hypothetical protein